MVSQVQSGLSPGAMGAASMNVGSARAEKIAEPTPSFQPVEIKKPEIKVDTEQMKQNLQEAINHLNEVMRDGGRGLNFSMDQALGRPVVYVKNAETGEVVRQIPNEVVVRVAHSIEELKGMLHNKVV